MRRRRRHRKPLRRTLTNCRQPHSSFHVSRRRARIKISARQLTRANRTPMRSSHSTRAKVWGKAKAAHRDSGLQLGRVQAKVKTKSATHPNLIARAQAPGKVKAEKDAELERELEKVETNPGT